MLKKECNYEFRQRIDIVHHKNMCDSKVPQAADEILIDKSWCITCPAESCAAVVETAKDLQDYFQTSMDLMLHVEYNRSKGIVLNLDKESKLAKGSFELDVTGDTVTITASSSGGIRRGGVYLEDLLNLRGAPMLKMGMTCL